VLTEAVLLNGLAALLLVTWLRGTLAFYIHPRYTPLVVVCAVVLFLMAGVRMRALAHHADGAWLTWSHALVALPLLVGVLVPARPLGAETLAGRGLDAAFTSRAVTPAMQQMTGEPDSWNLWEWSMALAMQGDALQGKPVDVVGFVFPDERLGSEAFYVVRYTVTCCAADAAAVALPVRWAESTALPADTWVQVQGTLGTITRDAQTLPAIVATTVVPVEQPARPYLLP
jgi:uncharacterized repeat protein (TIGR03943 family)